MKSYNFRFEIEQEEDGRWSTHVPALPGCVAWGYTKEEAIEGIRDATQSYIEILIEDGREIPADESTSVVDYTAVSVVA